MKVYNFAAIRQLCEAAFNEADFQRFCETHFPEALHKFPAGGPYRARIITLIEHVERYEELETLLTQIRNANPYQFGKLEAALYAAPAASVAGSPPDQRLTAQKIQGVIMGNVGHAEQHYHADSPPKAEPAGVRADISQVHANGNISQHIGDDIHIHAGGDVTFAKDQARAIAKKLAEKMKPQP